MPLHHKNQCQWLIDDDFTSRHLKLCADACKLSQWQASPTEPPTEVFKLANSIWLVRSDLGGLGFNLQPDRVQLSVTRDIDVGWLQSIAAHYWLPFAFLYWGYQVLHASACQFLSGEGQVIAFTGNSETGKSTFGYAFGQRQGWRQSSDDSLIFADQEGTIALRPAVNSVRLRPATADHFGVEAGHYTVSANGTAAKLAAIYHLYPTENSVSPRIALLNRSESYTTLLEQAFTLPIREMHRRLMRDYLALTVEVPVYRLHFHKDFGCLATTIDAVVNHFKQKQTMRFMQSRAAS